MAALAHAWRRIALVKFGLEALVTNGGRATALVPMEEDEDGKREKDSDGNERSSRPGCFRYLEDQRRHENHDEERDHQAKGVDIGALRSIVQATSMGGYATWGTSARARRRGKQRALQENYYYYH